MAALGMAVGLNGMAFYAVGALIGPLHAAFGWSRAVASGVTVCLMAGQMLTAPLVGTLIGRIGARRLACLSMLAMAAGFAAISLAASPPGYYVLWLLTALGGGGTTSVLWSRVVLGGVRRHRGLSLGLALCGTGLAGIVVPVALAWATTSGWRDGPRLLAAIAAVGAVVVWFGLGAGPAVARPDQADGQAAGLSLRQAVRRREFWVLELGFAVIALCVAALIVHLVPMLADRGVSPAAAATVAGGIGLAALVGRAASGALADRLHPPLVAAVVLLLPAGAAWWLACDVSAGRGAALLIGLAAGAEIDLLALLCGWCFGLRQLARIHGWLVFGFCLGSAAGPPLAGLVRDVTGSYHAALIAASGLLVLAALSLLSLRREPA